MANELIAKLEAATKACSKLDMEIKAVVYGGVVLQSPFNGKWCLYREGTTDARTGKTCEQPFNVDHALWINDRYTASIDAALTLVPEGWGLDIRHPARGHLEKFDIETLEFSYCRLHNLPNDVIATAPTPALALCIAALKARAKDSQ